MQLNYPQLARIDEAINYNIAPIYDEAIMAEDEEASGHGMLHRL